MLKLLAVPLQTHTQLGPSLKPELFTEYVLTLHTCSGKFNFFFKLCNLMTLPIANIT
jgi:hypothetical protein